MPPPVPPACQPLAGDVAALETVDAQLRANLATLTGAAAWAVLAQIGDCRIALDKKRAELAACTTANSAALQANLVVIDLGPAPATPPSRTAQLWDLGQPIAAQRETAIVVGDAFSLVGPLPASFGVSVTTTGEADVIGPDFRSGNLTPATPLTRVELVVGPSVTIDKAQFESWLTQVLPYATGLSGGGGIGVTIRVSTGSIAFAPGRLTVTVAGEVDVQAMLGMTQRGPFSAGITLGLVPNGSPGLADPIDLVAVSDATIELPGLLGSIAAAVLPVMKSFVTNFATEQLRTSLRTEVPNAIERAFALAALPADVSLSLRRLSIDATGVTFQPALGAIGTTLSTFAPPTIPPP
jgi:hypothetical protein